MPIVQACSYKATIKTPLPADNYSEILATFAQSGENIITKDKADLLVLEDGLLVVRLTQQETLMFRAGIPALMQIRCYRNTYDAPGSDCWQIPVYEALNKEILG